MNDILVWLAPTIVSVGASIFCVGRWVQALANQRVATAALHRRLDDQKSRVERLERIVQQIRETLISENLMSPSGTQTGHDGQGVHNPLRRPDGR